MAGSTNGVAPREKSRPAELRIKDALGSLVDLPFAIRHRHAVTVSGHAKLRHRAIRLLPGCRVQVGDRSMVSAKILFDRAGSVLTIGERTFIGPSVLAIAGRMEIGSDVLIAWGCTIVDHDSHAIRFSERMNDVSDWYVGVKDWSHVPVSPVVIENKAWIGLNSVVLKGVRIGEGSVVAAGSVVTRDVEPWTVVAGNPARPIKKIPPDER